MPTILRVVLGLGRVIAADYRVDKRFLALQQSIHVFSSLSSNPDLPPGHATAGMAHARGVRSGRMMQR